MNAWTTVRGKVAKPTHHHLARKRTFCKTDIEEGSMPGPVEKTRAMSLGLPEDEESVMVVFIEPGLLMDGKRGSEVLSE